MSETAPCTAATRPRRAHTPQRTRAPRTLDTYAEGTLLRLHGESFPTGHVDGVVLSVQRDIARVELTPEHGGREGKQALVYDSIGQVRAVFFGRVVRVDRVEVIAAPTWSGPNDFDDEPAEPEGEEDEDGDDDLGEAATSDALDTPVPYALTDLARAELAG